ncbi:hypothetical protein I314_05359 [Cryptococcus bacillisporus CA1873]|uniref:Uncharacterized protein n=1 Tax=Cryptococcus bacillisporus CA1873 TaxID=1296111 RepID=A0ABR5B5S3_CRYGA|nr:hypothetical protein I314_05359 [Cryptococcus bacillisporus CA1873]|eukprot:KIR58945.1 hypothetical protein I314_05359 [Cryptococcus gattii CA1873]
MFPSMLVYNEKQDLDTLSPPDLTFAHTQWLSILSSRLSELSSAREMSFNMDFGGAMAGDAENVAPIEQAMDESRRMVSVLGRELRRRGSEVEFL